MKNYKTVFPWTQDTSYAGYQNIIVAVLLFVLCLQIEMKHEIAVKVVQTISKVSLEIYMISYISDRLIYHVLNAIVSEFTYKLAMYPLISILILGMSGVVAFGINQITNVFVKHIMLHRREMEN